MENREIIGDILLRFNSQKRTLDELEIYVSSVLADLYKVKEMIQIERTTQVEKNKFKKKI